MSQKQLENLLKGLLEMALSGKINNKHETGSCANGYTHTEPVIKSQTIQSLPNLLHKVESRIKNGKIGIANGYKIHNLQNSIEELKEEAIEQMTSKEYTQSLQNNWETLEIKGEKNAQLICIRDIGSQTNLPKKPCPSLVTLAEDDLKFEQTEKIKNENSDVKTFDKSSQKGKKLSTKKSKSSLHLSHLPIKYLRKLVPLSKPRLKTILHGKLQHARFMKDKPMYIKVTRTPPWIVVEQISDHILDDILLLVAEEIQVNKILESLYNSEFQ